MELGRHIILYADGASRGNPGESAIGVVIVDESGKVIKELSKRIGLCTNNQAEYRSLIAGLETAIGLKTEHISIRMDSQLVVRQLQGQYRVRDKKLGDLFRRVTQLLNQVKGYSIRYLPREHNRRADKLANQALDAARH